MTKVLLAGATGYLGAYIARELQRRACFCRAVVRHPKKLHQKNIRVDETVNAVLTDKSAVSGCCEGMDVVISTVGITRQKDGLTYMEVDYQANMNLLEDALKHGVKKFIYVSVLHGEKLKHLKICEAKEAFVERLKSAGIDYCVIRPNGFFSDLSAFFDMAKNGRAYLLGNGEKKLNPIHGADLAEICVDAIKNPARDIEVGGPEILSQNDIARLAFEVLGTPPKITHIPDWVRKFLLGALRVFTGVKVYGPVEFFLTVMAMDMIAPEYGRHRLKAYFLELRRGVDEPIG